MIVLGRILVLGLILRNRRITARIVLRSRICWCLVTWNWLIVAGRCISWTTTIGSICLRLLVGTIVWSFIDLCRRVGCWINLYSLICCISLSRIHLLTAVCLVWLNSSIYLCRISRSTCIGRICRSRLVCRWLNVGRINLSWWISWILLCYIGFSTIS